MELMDTYNPTVQQLRSKNKQLRQRVAELEKEVAQWKNNHETEVRRARILKERTDMPIERVQAYEQWGKDQAERDALIKQRDELMAALEMIAGKRYCLDALMSNSDIAKAAIASVKEKAIAKIDEVLK